MCKGSPGSIRAARNGGARGYCSRKRVLWGRVYECVLAVQEYVPETGQRSPVQKKTHFSTPLKTNGRADGNQTKSLPLQVRYWFVWFHKSIKFLPSGPRPHLIMLHELSDHAQKRLFVNLCVLRYLKHEHIWTIKISYTSKTVFILFAPVVPNNYDMVFMNGVHKTVCEHVRLAVSKMRRNFH